jgi:hypothetical protein
MFHLLPCTHQDDIRFRAKHFAIKANRFLQSLFIFDSSTCLGYRHWRNVNLIFHKAPQENVPSCRLGLCVATFAVGKAFSKNFPHSRLWYIQLAASPTCWLPWTSVISLPNTIVSALVLGRPELFPLQMQPVSTKFLNHFLIEFAVGGSFSKFLLNSRWTVVRFRWMKLQHTKRFFAILRLCCTLVAKVEITSYACNKKLFRISLYNGVRLIFVCLLLSYQ